VPADVVVSVDEGMPWVSRGGVKLDNALDAFGLDVTGRRAVDVGASTGGFTDVLLARGCASVAAVDVAYGELAWKLRNDPRVVVLERLNARALTPADLPWAPDLLVADVSFISLTKVLPAVLACMAPVWDGLVMVKPQFEVGRERLGKGGVVRSAADRRSALVTVAAAARFDGRLRARLRLPPGCRHEGQPGGLYQAGFAEARAVPDDVDASRRRARSWSPTGEAGRPASCVHPPPAVRVRRARSSRCSRRPRRRATSCASEPRRERPSTA
jgi:TlyA family rRNA methyltransferase/putative hemolysin